MENDGLASPEAGSSREAESARQLAFVPPTPEDKGRIYGKLASELWKANKGRSELMNGMAAKLKGLPPVVLALPEMSGFLAHVQQLAFSLGVAAALELVQDKEALTAEPTASDEATISGEAKP